MHGEGGVGESLRLQREDSLYEILFWNDQRPAVVYKSGGKFRSVTVTLL